MSLDGSFYCRFCKNTELQTLEDLAAHRRDGYCHQPSRDSTVRLPFTRKSEAMYRLEAEKSNRKNKSLDSIDSYL